MDRLLTTIVAADLVGYSRLMAADEEGTLSRFRKVQAELVKPELAKGQARLIKTMGDGLLLEFPSPVEAVRACLSIQKSMVTRERDQDPARRLQFRIGINLGDVIIDGDDILGDGVNVAARLEGLAPPGGICISRAVHEQLRGKTDAALTPLGPQDVKNLPELVEVWRVEVDGVEPTEAPPKAAAPPSIVILPFDNMSSDPEQAFLADGIVEDVTTELSRFRTLTVIARNSAFSYKNTPKDVRQIARELGVTYVVEGSVRRAGERLRVTAQLIEGETGSHLWAERWDRTMADLFDLQDELTQSIVQAIEPELSAHERLVLRRKPTRNMDAWGLSQQGFSEYLTFSESGFERSFNLYHQAIGADPEFALPEAHLGRWYWMRLLSGRTTDFAEDLKKGLAHSRRAVMLDDRLDMAYISLGVLLGMAGRDADCRNALDMAERLNANNVRLHHARGIAALLTETPDCDLMEASARKCIALSPRDPQRGHFHLLLGNSIHFRDFDFSNPQVLEQLEIGCGFGNVDYTVFLAAAMCSAAAGDRGKAERYLRQALERNPDMTAKGMRSSFSLPAFRKYIEFGKPYQEILIELGLPRG